MNVPLALVAVDGDSAGDFDRPGITGVSIFVGTKASQLQARWREMRAANIDHLALPLLGAWALKPQE